MKWSVRWVPTTVVSSRKSSAAREEAPPAARDAGGSDGPPSLWRDVLQSDGGPLVQLLLRAQLGLNLLSAFDVVHVGCAGFNKVLGPLRGVLRGFTAAWLSWLWYRVQFSAAEPPHKSARRTSLRNRLVFQTAITVALMFLPETLKIMGGPSVAPSTENAVELEFAVPGLGCEACETAATRIINRQSGVLWSSVDFEAGTARIMVAKDWNFDTETLKSRLEYAGYGLDDASKATPQVRRVETVPGSGVDEKEQREIVAEEGMEDDGDDWID